MLIEAALTKYCPFRGTNCLADRCMWWRWDKGQEQPYEEVEIWYGDDLYPMPVLPSNAIDDEADHDEVVEMLRNCHAQIRANIVRSWQPPSPAGKGWTLHEKYWGDDELKPRAVFRRFRLQSGLCGVIEKPFNEGKPIQEIDHAAW